MLKHILKFKTVLILLLGMSLLYPSAFAQRYDRGHEREHGRDYERGYGRRFGGWHHRDIWGHGRYWRDGRWYRHGWFGQEISVPMFDGVIVSSLPSSCTIVGIQPDVYYLCGNQYFRPIPGGGYMEGSGPNSYVFNSD